MNTFRFHHSKKPFGPSPYWTVRIERKVLDEDEKVNENAARRLDAKLEPITEQMKYIDSYSGVVHMDKLDKDRALVLKQAAPGSLALEVLPLP
jgi:hypothetical protein